MGIKNQSWIVWAFLLGSCLAVILLFSPSLSAQCQMCRTGLTQSPEGQRWSRGINAGIMLLLAAPFVIGGSIALVIYRPQFTRALANVGARLGASKLGRSAYRESLGGRAKDFTETGS